MQKDTGGDGRWGEIRFHGFPVCSKTVRKIWPSTNPHILIHIYIPLFLSKQEFVSSFFEFGLVL